MTTAALRVEECLSRGGIADEHTFGRHRFIDWGAPLPPCQPEHAVQVLRDGLDVIVWKWECRHRWHTCRWSWTSASDDRDHQFSGLVAQERLRSQQVRSALLSPTQINPVTGGAVRPVESLASGEHRRVCERPL